MKIAYFISNRSTFPPDPKEIVASASVVENIVKYLSKKHEITVYAAKGSRYSGVKIIDLDLKPFKIDSNISDSDWITKAVIGMKQLFVGKILEDAEKYDIIHLNTEPVYLGMPMAGIIKTPILFTLHNIYHDFEEQIYCYYDNKVYITALSKNHAKTLPFRHKIPVIYNGIEVEEFDYNENSDSYYLFLGRLHETKGIDDFLGIAQRDKKNTYYIAGKGSKSYTGLVKDIARKHKNINFFGMAARKSALWKRLLSRAKALISPLQWEEPFGLFAIEAMSFGTPIIAYDRGAMSEIIEDGKTGFLVNYKRPDKKFTISKTGIAGIESAIKYINSMPDKDYLKMRQESRGLVEKKFTAAKMAKNYENLYKEIVKGKRRK